MNKFVSWKGEDRVVDYDNMALDVRVEFLREAENLGRAAEPSDLLRQINLFFDVMDAGIDPETRALFARHALRACVESHEDLLVAIWATQHEPVLEQELDLLQRGYRVVRFPQAPKWASGKDAWDQVCALLSGRTPDLVVGVIPVAMLPEYLRACGSVPLIRADMEAVTRGGDTRPSEYKWLGTWTRTVRVEVLTEVW